MKKALYIYLFQIILGLAGIGYDLYTFIYTYYIPSYIVSILSVILIIVASLSYFYFRKIKFEFQKIYHGSTSNVYKLTWPIVIVICIAIMSFAYISVNRYQITHNGYGLVDKFSKKVYILDQKTKEYK